MSLDESVASAAGTAGDAATKWPYIVGLISVVVGAVGLVFAPISGIVYVSLPGVAFATYHALASRSPVRVAMVVSAVALGIGLIAGLLAVYAFSGDSFIVQEWAAMAALLGMPILAIVVGLPALVVACFRPGVRPQRVPPVGQIG
jgi:hypothetical protein